MAAASVTALAGADTDPGGTPGGQVVAVAGADQAPLEGGPDDASFTPLAAADAAVASVGATTSTEAPAPTTTSTATVEDTPSSAAAASDDAATTSSAPTTTAAPTTTRAPTTTQAPPPPEPADEGYAYDDPRSTQVWLDLAQCESGGNWAADTGNGYYGGLQFSRSSWEGVGGTGYPHEHSRQTQIEMGRRLQARQGWGAWPHCSEELGLR